MRQVAFLLGKPPKASTLMARVLGIARARGYDVRVHLPHDAVEAVPDWLYGADLIVQRGLHAAVLADLLAVERAGVACCNPVRSAIAVQDRLALADRLARARLPLPATTPARTWAAVRQSSAWPCVVKTRDGSRGRGATVLVAAHGPLPSSAPFEGPYVVQDYVAARGDVRKLYVAGSQVRGLFKPAEGTNRRARTFRPSPSLQRLALDAGRALGLDIYGIDVVGGRIVDVNVFPGFRGVAGATQLVAERLVPRMLDSGCMLPESNIVADESFLTWG